MEAGFLEEPKIRLNRPDLEAVPASLSVTGVFRPVVGTLGTGVDETEILPDVVVLFLVVFDDTALSCLGIFSC